jgi:hypothetical protein
MSNLRPTTFARRLAVAAVWATPLALAIAASASGCTIRKVPATNGPAGSGGSSSAASAGSSGAGATVGTGGSTSNLTNRQLFEQDVLPGLEQNCVPCHVNGGFADFLAPPDQYSSITVYKSGTDHEPLVCPVPTQSILYSYPDSPSHTGTHFGTKLAALKTAVLQWLTREAADLPPQPEAGPMAYLTPFKPILGGLNVIYLDKLGPAYVGSSISFTVDQLGTPPSLLQLSTVEVYPTGIALHIVHPRFVVYPMGSAIGQPDPGDTLSDVDAVFTPGGLEGASPPTRLLGPGEVLIDNWQQDARIGIDFSEGMIDTVNLTADGGLVTLCNQPSVFQTAVTTLGMGGPLYCATTCHGGTKPTAQAAMDLSGLLASPPDYATACSYMRTRIVPGSPMTSQILEVTDPTNLQIVHMYKFGGISTAYAAFNTGMSPWITAEN